MGSFSRVIDIESSPVGAGRQLYPDAPCVEYARKFAEQIGERSEYFSWSLLTSENNRSLAATLNWPEIQIRMFFGGDGECHLFANSKDMSTPMENVFHMDRRSDNWLNVQTTVDIVNSLLAPSLTIRETAIPA